VVTWQFFFWCANVRFCGTISFMHSKKFCTRVAWARWLGRAGGDVDFFFFVFWRANMRFCGTISFMHNKKFCTSVVWASLGPPDEASGDVAFFLFLARKLRFLRDYFFQAQQEVLHKRRLGQPRYLLPQRGKW